MSSTKNKTGRPSKYDPKYCEQLVEHMAGIHSFETFAAIINVNPDTLYEWAKQHPEFSEAKKIGRMKCQLGCERLFKAQAAGKIKGNPASLIFFAKNVTTMRDDPIDDVESVDGINFDYQD
jgi:hypothetical protein